MNNLNLLILISLFLNSCNWNEANSINITKSSQAKDQPVTLSQIKLINNQFVLTGANFQNITQVKMLDGATQTILEIESLSATQIVTNSLSNMTIAAGKVMSFILSSAHASSSFVVDFSLCNSTLNGKGFNCSVTANDKDVLSFDATSNKWVPRNLNGLNYKGTFSAAGGTDPGGAPDAGDYFIISVSGTIAGVAYAVGDWISYSGDEWQRVANARTVLSTFGRTGNITAREGDYDLNKMSDVDLATLPPANGNFLMFGPGGKWIPGTATLTESDPGVSAFAKATLPTCAAGEALKGNGTTLSCVTVSGAPSGSASGDLAGSYPGPTLTTTGVTAGTYRSVTVDAKGRVSAGSNPTTLAGYGITDTIVSSITGTAPLAVSGTATVPIISLPAATTSVSGYLTTTDWNHFNDKQAPLSAGATINGIGYPANGTQTLTVPLAPVNATDVANKLYVDNAVGGVWTAASGNAYRLTGNVGIGNSGPRATLDVSGTIATKPATLNGTATIDGSTGNIHYTAASCGTFQFNNLKDGASYMFVVQGASSATCTFTAFSDVATTALSVHMPPDNGATVASKHTIFNLTVVGTHVYVAWTPGY
jgi:hypothetical protein